MKPYETHARPFLTLNILSIATVNRKTMKSCLIITMILLIFMIQVGIADNTGTIEPANENDWPIVAITTGQRYLIQRFLKGPFLYYVRI